MAFTNPFFVLLGLASAGTLWEFVVVNALVENQAVCAAGTAGR
jgi:hypothetical protein